MKESHGYRFVSRTTKAHELYELLREYMVKDFKENDKGKNCVFKIDNITLLLSLTSGKLTIYCKSNKTGTRNKIRTIVSNQIIAAEIMNSLRLNKKEVRNHIGLDTKRGYCDYIENQPLPPKILQKKIDELDIVILSYAERQISIGTNLHKWLGMNYHKVNRRLDRLSKLRLLEKVDRSPATYEFPKDCGRSFLIREFISIWPKLFHSTPAIFTANSQEMQNGNSMNKKSKKK